MQGEEYIKKGKKFYDELGKVFCPYLKKNVEFTSNGFNHLVYKGDRTRRSEIEISMRIKSLYVVKEILESSGTTQEIEQLENKQRFYGFIAVIENKKYKVVVGTDLTGNRIIFRSVIPSWKTNKRDSNLHKVETKKPS